MRVVWSNFIPINRYNSIQSRLEGVGMKCQEMTLSSYPDVSHHLILGLILDK